MWAQASMTPFSQYKGWTAEGGIRNALIVSGPVVQRTPGSVNHGVMHIADILPTLLEVAGTRYPEAVNGQPAPPLIGKSWMPVLSGQAESPRGPTDVLAWQIFGNLALRQGDWKIRWQHEPMGKADWELFNLATDPAEREDLASKEPARLAAMKALWDAYARENNVIIPNRSPFETLKDQLPTRVPVEAGFPPLNYQRQFVPPPDMVAPPRP
jgi:arylsulfatase